MAAVVVAGMPLGVAAADVPEALDRVPADTPVVISIGNVNAFFDQADAIAGVLDQPQAQGGIMMARSMLSMPGINADGSAAIAILSIEDIENDEPPMVILVPVSDYNAVVTGLGGSGEGLEALDIEGETVFVKSAGEGFAAIGPEEDVLAGFAAEAGNAGDHEDRIGETGSRMSDENAVLIIANMEHLKEPMLEGWAEGAANMQQMMAMGGAPAEQTQAQVEMIDGLVKGFAEQADRGLMGFTGGDYGFSVEFGVNFKEGTEFANTFAGGGNATELLGKLPGGDYLFAYAMDYSSQGIKDAFGKLASLGEQGNQFPGMSPAAFIETSDGIAQVMGVSPGGLMGGGLLSAMTAVIQTNDADALIGQFSQQMKAANDQVVNGISMTTNFNDAGEAVAGTTAHRWSMQMLPDMSQPGAMQMQMMMPMLFGPTGGPNGYIAKADADDVVVTYSTKSDMLEKAVQSATNGGALAQDQLLKQQADRLHSEPIMLAYVDGGAIMNMVLPTIAMFAGPVNLDVPENVTPLAMSLAGSGGGMSFRTVVPQDLIQLGKDTGAAFGAMGGGMGGGGPEESPSF
ncbi:MAG: hypothetical protein Phyf2KO_17870 [Phycisphaerales bacterium]